MKKTLVIAAAALISASAFAQTVTSANIVGYSKQVFDASQIRIVAPQFLTAPTNGIALGDAFSGLTDQSKLYTWNGSSYASYVYFAGYGWYDGAYNVADGVLIEQGDAAWLQNAGGATNVIMSGEVPMTGSITNNLVAGINLIANPYPVALALGNIPAASLSDGDQAYVWNGTSYSSYIYFAGYGWYDGAYNVADDVEVAVGQGFWLSTAASGSLVLDKQY